MVGKGKLLGEIKFDLATVYEQPDHAWNNKLLPLQDYARPTDVLGFIKYYRPYA